MRIDRRGRTDLLVEMHANHFDRRAPVARQRTGDGFVERHAERVEIGTRVDAILPQHLGGHVLQRSADLAVEHLTPFGRQAEVHDLGVALVVDKDVRRLEIEMNDAEVMDVVKPRRDLQDHAVERVPVLPVKKLRDALPGKELHREVRKALLQHAEIEDLDDAGVLDRAERGKLGLEAKKLLRIADLVTEDLDRLVTAIRNHRTPDTPWFRPCFSASHGSGTAAGARSLSWKGCKYNPPSATKGVRFVPDER